MIKYIRTSQNFFIFPDLQKHSHVVMNVFGDNYHEMIIDAGFLLPYDNMNLKPTGMSTSLRLKSNEQELISLKSNCYLCKNLNLIYITNQKPNNDVSHIEVLVKHNNQHLEIKFLNNITGEFSFIKENNYEFDFFNFN